MLLEFRIAVVRGHVQLADIDGAVSARRRRSERRRAVLHAALAAALDLHHRSPSQHAAL